MLIFSGKIMEEYYNKLKHFILGIPWDASVCMEDYEKELTRSCVKLQKDIMFSCDLVKRNLSKQKKLEVENGLLMSCLVEKAEGIKGDEKLLTLLMGTAKKGEGSRDIHGLLSGKHHNAGNRKAKKLPVR